MDIREYFRKIPGKTGENSTFLPLWMHLEDTAAMIKYLLENRISQSVIRASGLDRDQFRKISMFLARIHDLGKCTPLFLSRIAASAPSCREHLQTCGLAIPELSEYSHERNIPHALAGEILLRKFQCPEGICAVVGAHHGKPSTSSDCTFNYATFLSAYPLSFFARQEEKWSLIQRFFVDWALSESGYSSVEELPKLSNCAQMLLTGLLIQSDWIASNQTFFPMLCRSGLEEEYNSQSRIYNALRRLSLPEMWIPHIPDDDCVRFYQNRFGFNPNLLQQKTFSLVQESKSYGGLYIIEAQMGTGKTEAALAVAELLAGKNNCGGLFFGLPTQATSNGIFPRLSQWAEHVSKGSKHSIRLVHGMAELNEDYLLFSHPPSKIDEEGNPADHLTVHSWFSGKKQALLADFVIGTVDTVLMSALQQKHVMLRHLGLSGKVVIIDECHAYDAYMSRFLLRMLQWLGAYQIPVVLLSATLPVERKREMVQAYCMLYSPKKKLELPETAGYPLLTWADQNTVCAIPVQEQRSDSAVTVKRLNVEEMDDDLRMRLSDGGCAGVIVNTVKRAQEIAKQLRQIFPDKKVLVFHAQFIAQDRIRREKELMEMIGKSSTPEQRSQIIIVGTQVLEQSLDIDFDYLITELCPMDLMLQRIGRLHRHERMRPLPVSRPICAVLGTEGKFDRGSVSIYGEWLLKQTRRYLPETILLPHDIPILVNSVYAEPKEAQSSDPAWVEFHNRTEIKEEKADAWCLTRPKASKRESGNSIIGMLDRYIDNDKKAEASVRDGMTTVDVLVMCRQDADHIGCLPWIGNMRLRCDTVPSEEEARQIALQRLRLPFVFGIGKKMDEVIETLEQENCRWLSQWQDSPWLKGELILLLDSTGERDLCGFHLYYDKENGLRYERKGE